jgi:hypothetical protein
MAAGPNTTSGVLGLALDRVVFSFRIFWPVDSKTVEYRPFAEIHLTHRTGASMPQPDACPVNLQCVTTMTLA